MRTGRAGYAAPAERFSSRLAPRAKRSARASASSTRSSSRAAKQRSRPHRARATVLRLKETRPSTPGDHRCRTASARRLRERQAHARRAEGPSPWMRESRHDRVAPAAMPERAPRGPIARRLKDRERPGHRALSRARASEAPGKVARRSSRHPDEPFRAAPAWRVSRCVPRSDQMLAPQSLRHGRALTLCGRGHECADHTVTVSPRQTRRVVRRRQLAGPPPVRTARTRALRQPVTRP